MNGGYILMDFTKIYDVYLDDAIDAVEITKEDYDDILSKAKYSFESGKPILLKAKLYDQINYLSFTSFIVDDTIIYFGYYDSADKMIKRVEIYKDSGKYYIGLTQ